MAIRFDDAPGWRFAVEEISAGMYEVVGTDEAGRSIRLSGQDPEELLQRCRADAAKLIES